MTVYNGELIFAGTFDRANGQAIDGIARWDGTTVRPLGGGLRLSFDEADIRGLAVFNNELYAAGQFDLAGGAPVAGIARWNGTTWSAVGSGVRNSISGTIGYPRCLHVHNGELVVGGEFDRAGGLVANNLARWNGTAWSALGTGSFATVYALETYGTQLIAAGQFQVGSNVAMPGAWNGTAWSAIGTNSPTVPSGALRTLGTQLYADTGGLLSRFDGTTWSTAGVIAGIFSGYQGTSIRAMHSHGGELIVGGEFTRAGPTPNVWDAATACIAAFDGVATWRALGGGLGISGRVTRMLPWRNGWVAAGVGDAGAAPSSGLAFYDGDRWNVLGHFSGGSGGSFDCAVYQGDLIVTGGYGGFTHIDGQPFPSIARFDGSQWHAFGSLAPPTLYAHGSDLFAFGGTALQQWNGTTFAIAAVPPTGSIDALHTHSDGQLYVANNDWATHRILVWNGTQLQPIGTANDSIQVISSFGSELVIGGRFTAVNGTPAALMARWNGSGWRAMPAPVSGYAAYAFGELDGVLYAGVSGDPRGLCLALQNNTWQSVGTGTDGLPQLFFADRATASLYTSGPFFSAGGLPSHGFAEWRRQPAWRNRLHGLAGAAGLPLLLGRGAMQANTTATWTIEGPPNLPMLFGLGLSRNDQALFGGLLVPSPDVVLFLLADAQGVATSSLTVPPGFGAGVGFFSQAWLLDATGPQGLTATNALECSTQ